MGQVRIQFEFDVAGAEVGEVVVGLLCKPGFGSQPFAWARSEIIDQRGGCPEIALAPNHKRRIVERSPQIIHTGANGHGICRPVLKSAANCPGIASRPPPDHDYATIRKNRTCHLGAPHQHMNVRIKLTVHDVMENRTREVSKDSTVPPRIQYIGGSRIPEISRYAQPRKTDREAGIRAVQARLLGLVPRLTYVGVAQAHFYSLALGRLERSFVPHGC